MKPDDACDECWESQEYVPGDFIEEMDRVLCRRCADEAFADLEASKIDDATERAIEGTVAP